MKSNDSNKCPGHFLELLRYFSALIFFLKEIPMQNCFGAKLFSIVNLFSQFLQHILQQTEHSVVQRKYLSPFTLLEMPAK